MTEYAVTKTETLPDGRLRIWRRNTDDGSLHTNTFRPDALACRGAEYGITDPAAILDVILHEVTATGDGDVQPCDDPAVMAGWVTSTSPDAEPVHLYNAVRTADAYGAHRARIDGCGHRVADPDGLLPGFLAGVEVDWALFREHRERVDTTRWHLIYGGLPETPRGDGHA